MAVIHTSFQDDLDRLTRRETVFCSGYYDEGMHIGVAISDANPNLYAVYGDKPSPTEHFCTPQSSGCATFSLLQVYQLLVSRIEPPGELTVRMSNYGSKTLLNRWKRGDPSIPRWYDAEGRQLSQIADLTHKVAPRLTFRYGSTREFSDLSRLLEMRETMRRKLSTM